MFGFWLGSTWPTSIDLCKEKATVFSGGRTLLLSSVRAVGNHGCFLVVIWFLPDFGKESGELTKE